MNKYHFCLATIFIVLYFCVAAIDASRYFNKVPHHRRVRSSEGEYHPDGKNHPCYRTCDGVPRTCFYHFNLEWYESMSKACFDCPFNVHDCGRKHCVVGNGVSRQITVINRQMPGPAIQVCHGDRIVVNVTNGLMAAGTAIHWHGMHQKDTPYMDGVPFVTQCPVQPESTFSYKFTATQNGTHFYHAHIGLQRGDGVFGALIVRKQKTEETYTYDEDLADHVILVQDWTNRTSQSVYTNHYHSGGSMNPSSLLINGGGRFKVITEHGTATTKAPVFNVIKFKTYRFRLINTGFSFCPVEISVDRHNITIISSDGNDLEPVTTKSFVSYAGERFDFIINSSQKVGNYWIKFRGLLNCANSPSMRQLAVLHYDGADNNEPRDAPEWESHEFDQINPVNQGEELDVNTPITKLKYSGQETDEILKETPDDKFYVAYDLYIKDNVHFNNAPYYGHGQVNKSYSVPTPQFNHISMQLPASPLLVTRSEENFCNEDIFRAKNEEGKCKKEFCQCPHVLSVKLNSVVEVVLIDEGRFANASHPIHLHGHSFRVIGMERLGAVTSVEDIKYRDIAGKLLRNLDGKPPLKDTVIVPDGGYTIIRFKANNPGYWFFHCHIEFHAEVGMALVFKVGEHEDMVPVPENFPTCGDYGNNGSV